MINSSLTMDSHVIIYAIRKYFVSSVFVIPIVGIRYEILNTKESEFRERKVPYIIYLFVPYLLYPVLYCSVLFCTVPYCIVLYCTVFCS